MAKRKRSTVASATEIETGPIVLNEEESARLDAMLVEGGPRGALAETLAEKLPSQDDARVRRLARVGAPPSCPMLGTDLDVGPRARACRRPTEAALHSGGRVGVYVVSLIAGAIIEAGVTSDELEHAARWLRARGR